MFWERFKKIKTVAEFRRRVFLYFDTINGRNFTLNTFCCEETEVYTKENGFLCIVSVQKSMVISLAYFLSKFLTFSNKEKVFFSKTP